MTPGRRNLVRALRVFQRHECHLYVGIVVTLLAWLGLRRGAGGSREGPPPSAGRSVRGRRRSRLLRGLPPALVGLAGATAWYRGRIPATFLAVGLLLCWALLAGYGLRRILHRETSPFRQGIIVTVLVGGLLAENFSAPVPLTRVDAGGRVPAVYAWLGDHGGEAPVAELPFTADEAVTAASIPGPWRWIWRVRFVAGPLRAFAAPGDRARFTWVRENLADTYAQLHSIDHWHPILNGYSARRPPLYGLLRRRLASFPDPDSLSLLQALGVRYVLYHYGLASREASDRLRAALLRVPESAGLRRIGGFEGDELFELIPGEALPGPVGRDLSLRMILPERTPRKGWVEAGVGLANRGRAPLVLVPPTRLELAVRLQPVEGDGYVREETIRVRCPPLVEEGGEVVVPFRFRAPPREGRYRVSVRLEGRSPYPFPRHRRLAGEIVVQGEEKERGPSRWVLSYRRFLESLALRRLSD